MMDFIIYIAIGVISLVILFAQVQLFAIKDLLKEIRDQGKSSATINITPAKCVICGFVAPLQDGECPDCRH